MKTAKPYIIIGSFIILLSGIIFYFIAQYSQNYQEGSASLFSSPKIIAEGRHYIDLPLSGGGSGCVRKIWQDNGAFSWYVGHWNGSGDCALVANRVTNKLNNIASTVTSVPNNTPMEVDTLSLGILDTQIKLVQMGLLPESEVTAVFSQATSNALKVFQKNNNIPSTGAIGPETARILSTFPLPTKALFR